MDEGIKELLQVARTTSYREDENVVMIDVHKRLNVRKIYEPFATRGAHKVKGKRP